MKEVLWRFMHIKEKTEGNYKETYELWRQRNPMTRKKIYVCICIGAHLQLNYSNYILQAEIITIAGIYEKKENIRLRVWNDTEDHPKGMNGDKMTMNDKELQKRDQEAPILVQVKQRIKKNQDQQKSSTHLSKS